MRRAVIILFLAIFVVACKLDHLHYETSDMVTVRLNIDWSESGYSPNGVTIYLYDSKGDRYGSSILSSNTELVNLTLPADTYTIVLHNNSRSEFTNVEFINSDKLSTFTVRSLEWNHPYYEPDTDEFVALEPENIVSATVRDVVVSSDVIKYHYDKPDLTEYTSTEVVEVNITPAHIVHVAEVQAHIENAHNAVEIPIALVHGMSRGYLFGMECTLSDRVLEEFYIDVGIAISSYSAASATSVMAVTRADDDDSYTYEDDDIYLDFRTFGLPFDIPSEDVDFQFEIEDIHKIDDDFHDIYIELLFYMADGLLYHIYSDVTESVEIDDIGNMMKYTITLTDDLNNYEPYYDDDFELDNDDEEDLNSGMVDSSIDNWVDVAVPLPL